MSDTLWIILVSAVLLASMPAPVPRDAQSPDPAPASATRDDSAMQPGRELSQLFLDGDTDAVWARMTPPMRPWLLGRVPTAVEDVLALAMAKDPRRRFASAITFAQAFITARRGRTVAIDPPPNAWT